MSKFSLTIWIIVAVVAGVVIGYSLHRFGAKAVGVGIVLFGAGFLAGARFGRLRQRSAISAEPAEQ